MKIVGHGPHPFCAVEGGSGHEQVDCIAKCAFEIAKNCNKIDERCFKAGSKVLVMNTDFFDEFLGRVSPLRAILLKKNKHNGGCSSVDFLFQNTHNIKFSYNSTIDCLEVGKNTGAFQKVIRICQHRQLQDYYGCYPLWFWMIKKNDSQFEGAQIEFVTPEKEELTLQLTIFNKSINIYKVTRLQFPHDLFHFYN